MFYYTEEEMSLACSSGSGDGHLHRAIMEVGDMIDSNEINEAEECLKCGGDKDDQHMLAQKVHDLDEYWTGVKAEKDENRSL